jgi:hypothetical protein
MAEWIVLAGVAITFITSVMGFLTARSARSRTDEVHDEVKTISVNVDGRLSEFVLRVAQLTEALHEGGVQVPPPEPSRIMPPSATITGRETSLPESET